MVGHGAQNDRSIFLLSRFRVYCRQPLPYRIMEGLPVVLSFGRLPETEIRMPANFRVPRHPPGTRVFVR